MGRGLLFLTGGMFIVVGIIQLGINNRQQMLPQRTIEYHTENQSKNITTSLIDYAISEIREDQEWKGSGGNGFSSSDFLGGEGSIRVYDRDDFLDSTVDVPDNSIPFWNEFTLLLHATATYEGKEVETEVMLTKDAFSKFSYFTDVEQSNIWFFGGDELTGRVHSNGQLNIAGDPTFHGLVTSTQMYREHSGGADPQFLGGTIFDHEAIDLPTDDQLDILRAASNNGGIKFDHEVFITLNSDGTTRILENVNGNWNNNPVEHNFTLSNYNGVISSSEKVYIKGQLKGQLTVHSEDDIEILGDLTYSEDPRDNPASSDILGLVSEAQVLVDDDAHRDNGSQNLEIHASIMALDRSFTVEDYWEGSPKGELKILGGLIQERRGPVGTFSGGSLRSGYSKNYEYDERLERMFPPSFPRESFFSIVYWKDNLQ